MTETNRYRVGQHVERHKHKYGWAVAAGAVFVLDRFFGIWDNTVASAIWPHVATWFGASPGS